MAPGFAGKCLPCVKLMEASILQEFNLQHHRYLRKMVEFIHYSFKELADLDRLEYSALSRLNLLNYVTRIQCLCVADDVFWWSLFNTNVDGERLLVRELNGATCVIGWHEIQLAFGAVHDQRDEFRHIKIAHKQFAGPRFTSAQVYCYMRSLHGFKTNWVKALLHGLRTEILFLQKRARENNDKCKQIILVVWASMFLQILYIYRQTIFTWSTLSEAEGWLGSSHMSRDGDTDIHALVARFPSKMEDLREIREKCKLTDHIPIASSVRDERADCAQPDSAPKTRTRKRPRPSSVTFLL
ncbi:hypothetical protein R1sor_010453 [Riccia sorocarpa]|uniref:Uncharacterized protein n=1 Tax=Riccia sorocarpa TaxID=122646 RepID=A0ABD3HY28_9MARC